MELKQAISCLTDSDPDVRKSAADALGQIGSAEACQALVSALKHPLADIRLNAVEALARCPSEETARVLMGILSNDPVSGVRQGAARSLGQIGRIEPLAALLDALD